MLVDGRCLRRDLQILQRYCSPCRLLSQGLRLRNHAVEASKEGNREPADEQIQHCDVHQVSPVIDSPLTNHDLSSHQGKIDFSHDHLRSHRIFLKPADYRRKKKRNSTPTANKPLSKQPRRTFDPEILSTLLSASTLHEKVDDFHRHIESFKPFESTVGRKRYENIHHQIDKAFSKAQIRSYAQLFNDKSSTTKLKTSQRKAELIDDIISKVWNVVQSEKVQSDELIITKMLTLTPAMQFFIMENRARFFNAFKSFKLPMKVKGSKLYVSGVDSTVSAFEMNFLRFKKDIKKEQLDLTQLQGKFDTHDLKAVASTAQVFMPEVVDNDFVTLESYSQADLDIAKRLLSWSVSKYNPHLRTDVWNKAALKNETLVPFVNKDIWSWNEKDFQYYSILRQCGKPGCANEMIFDKFDCMNESVLQSKSLENLTNHRNMLHLRGKPVSDPGDWQKSGETEAGADSAYDQQLNSFNLDGILENRQRAPGLESARDNHLNIEDLRHQLGKFDRGEFDVDEFPDVSKLVEDVEGKSNDQVVDELRTGLGAFNDADASMFDELLKDFDEETTDKGKDDAFSTLTGEDTTDTLDESNSSTGNEFLGESISQDAEPQVEAEAKVPSPLAKNEISNLYTQLCDFSFAPATGKTQTGESYVAFTVQIGAVLLQNKPTPSNSSAFAASPVSPNDESDYQFMTNVPFVKDIATSFPVLYNNGQPFTNSIQIRLSPSIHHGSISNLDYPPVEIQAELDSSGCVRLDTLQILSIEAMRNVITPLVSLPCDLQVTRIKVSDLLTGTQEERFKSQPDFERFLDESQLNFGGVNKVQISPVLELNFDGKKIAYDFIHLTYKTDLNFDFKQRRGCLSLIEGGEFGGRKFEVILGEGELSQEEFEQFLNDAVQFINYIN
ncbi:uncharacterized protein LODBEIA_P53220 [Lodderomyces beijingensis]|uniref:Mediator complex subunit 1 n=1 Tax=Lodderomyces beijingensis TaxID=1775926 RepID=A0ABP0ZSJ0_9ASCO